MRCGRVATSQAAAEFEGAGGAWEARTQATFKERETEWKKVSGRRGRRGHTHTLAPSRHPPIFTHTHSPPTPPSLALSLAPLAPQVSTASAKATQAEQAAEQAADEAVVAVETAKTDLETKQREAAESKVGLRAAAEECAHAHAQSTEHTHARMRSRRTLPVVGWWRATQAARQDDGGRRG